MFRARRLPIASTCLSLVCAALLAAACNDGAATLVAPPEVVPFSQTDLVVGTGADAATGRRVTVNYTGWLYDAARADQKGTQFDTSIGRGPFAFTIGAGGIIPGFSQGVNGMKVGGIRRVVIPPSLAYGTQGNGAIPPNATLVFDVELLDVQ